MYIVLLETSGNQRYIFSTNKLRENVGASELTYQIGTKVVKKYVDEINKSNNNDAIQPIITTSGKSLLLVSGNDDSTAKKLVSKVTQHALENMAGLTINGAICKVTDATDAKSLHEAVGDVHKRLEEIRYQIPSNLQRFQRIPFVAECNTSNLPAEKLYLHPSLIRKEGETLIKVEDEMPHSLVSITKQDTLKQGKMRLENTIRKAEKKLYQINSPSLFQFADNPKKLDLESRFKNTKWFAVIHADGNGLGQIFLDFQKEIEAKTGEKYREKYRNFSDALDECTENATAFALKNLQTEYLKNQKNKNIDLDKFEVPAIPLVLGGDDLTIICDGQYAIKFTKDFLNEFVKETKTNPKIIEVFTINGKLKEVNLGICAGIAIIKPHFPFHQAYHLAEELLQSAKKTKKISTSLSAFDYHVLYDSSGTTLEEIREKTPFVARPYIVSEKTEAIKLANNHSDNEKWVENHHFCELEKRVDAMLKPEKDDETKRKLPNSQLHVLREGLLIDEAEAEARANLIKHRYEDQGFNELLCDGKLFFKDVFDGKTTQSTHFLDALDIVEFWK